jgi:hypothetical protein
MIVVLTEPGDACGERIAATLSRRGLPNVLLGTASLPRSTSLSLSLQGDGVVAALVDGDRRIDFAEVGAIMCRRPRTPVPHPQLTDPTIRRFVAEECAAALSDLWLMVDCLWVPGPPSVLHVSQYKALGLRVARQLGLEIPRTLVTNDPSQALEFYRSCNGRIIRKQTGPWQFSRYFDQHARYTDVVSTRDIGHVSSLRYCPMTLQEYVDKELEIRATVVGNRMFAAQIHSQASNRTKHDWRRYDYANQRYAPHRLPAEVEDRCIELVQALGLSYGAIDLVLTPDGRYVFLEINPAGEYLWIEELGGLPITDAICDLLADGARGLEKPRRLACL